MTGVTTFKSIPVRHSALNTKQVMEERREKKEIYLFFCKERWTKQMETKSISLKVGVIRRENVRVCVCLSHLDIITIILIYEYSSGGVCVGQFYYLFLQIGKFFPFFIFFAFFVSIGCLICFAKHKLVCFHLDKPKWTIEFMYTKAMKKKRS